jgi:1-deoxy-D-xylulose-5-phosphate reductoisomerase
MVPKRVSILGATGSVGDSTLSVIRQHKALFEVFAITGHHNITKLLDISEQFLPRYVVLSDQNQYIPFMELLHGAKHQPEVLVGLEAMNFVASHSQVNIVVSAIVGVAGFAPTYAAAQAGKVILLANKESLVFGGHWMKQALEESGAVLLPLDSEHNAIYQCLHGQDESSVESLILTASGGSFRNYSIEELDHVTPQQACQHPNWSMGSKISVDSSTLMNKGLEVIEASYLFDMPVDKIQVVIHPQSIIHSMVQYEDGSILAQMGTPDMRIPIAYALHYPQRLSIDVPRLDFTSIGSLNFQKPDTQKFPCLDLAFQALRHGGVAPLVLNAANEVSVASFLNRQITFLDIPRLNRLALEYFLPQTVFDVASAYALDQEVRLWVQYTIERVA